MSQANVVVVEQAWRALNRGDVDALVDLQTEDVDFRPPSHLVDGSVFTGHTGVRAWWERVQESWTELEGVPHQLACVGEHVVVAADMRVVGRESGVPASQRIFIVYTLRDGKISASIAYSSAREALEAVGLTEQRRDGAADRAGSAPRLSERRRS
jgi:ketosteroid isomerase-like protein